MDSTKKIISSAKESMISIGKKKTHFIILFSLQIFFFIAIIFSSSYFIPGILENANNIIGYSNNVGYTEEIMGIEILQQKNPLGENPEFLESGYVGMFKKIYYLLVSLFLSFVIFNGSIWYVSDIISKKTKKIKSGNNLESIKRYIGYISKFGVISLVVLFLFLTALYSSSKIFLNNIIPANVTLMTFFLIVSLGIIFLIFPSIVLIKENNILGSIKKSVLLTKKNFVFLLVIYVIILIYLSLVFWFMIIALEKNIIILILVIIALILSFVYTKIFLCNCIKRIEK